MFREVTTCILEGGATVQPSEFGSVENVLAHARRWLRDVLIYSGRCESRGRVPCIEVRTPKSPTPLARPPLFLITREASRTTNVRARDIICILTTSGYLDARTDNARPRHAAPGRPVHAGGSSPTFIHDGSAPVRSCEGSRSLPPPTRMSMWRVP